MIRLYILAILIANSVILSYSQVPSNIQAIDLGLPSGTKWANMNMDASTQYEIGGEYCWGTTDTTAVYRAIDTGGASISLTDYDVAHVKWGGNWQMPTYDDFRELKNYCSITWTTNNGTEIAKLTGPNGKSIVMPVTDHFVDEHQPGVVFWTSSNQKNYFMYKQYYLATLVSTGGATSKYPIRPVFKEKSTNSCTPPTVQYDGHYLTLSTDIQDATIYYTLDGSTPSQYSNKYTGKINANGLNTLKAYTVRWGYDDSEWAVYQVESYNSDNIVKTSKPGILENAFAWTTDRSHEQLSVSGFINSTDIKFLMEFKQLQHLDLSNAVFENYSIASKEFSGMNILTLKMPKDVNHIGDSIFLNCKNLAAVQCGTIIPFTQKSLSAIVNPNLLLYVQKDNNIPSGNLNVIRGGVAANVLLTDGPNNNFFCPESFVAQRISYTHNFTQKTIKGISAGWETITLPFNAQYISHSEKGEISPFGGQKDGTKNFWLYELNNGQFVPASKINANKAYIISMPNCEDYTEIYNLNGYVSFSSENITVNKTQLEPTQYDGMYLMPTMTNIVQKESIYAINKGEIYNGNEAGSIFVSGLRDIAPFEAYLTFPSNMAKANVVRISDLLYDEDIANINAISLDDEVNIFVSNRTVYVNSAKPRTIRVYSTNGIHVRTVFLREGINAISDLPSGAFIIGNSKIYIPK